MRIHLQTQRISRLVMVMLKTDTYWGLGMCSITSGTVLRSADTSLLYRQEREAKSQMTHGRARRESQVFARPPQDPRLAVTDHGGGGSWVQILEVRRGCCHGNWVDQGPQGLESHWVFFFLEPCVTLNQNKTSRAENEPPSICFIRIIFMIK